MLSVIVVNYRSSQLILDCIQSVYRFNEKLPLEIIIVDNDSGDNSEHNIISRFPGVKWIQMGYNAGFARANNAGMKVAAGNTFTCAIRKDACCQAASSMRASRRY